MNPSTPDSGPPAPVCGNGIIELGEACDDGNTGGEDGCSKDCTTVEAGFTCAGAPSSCKTTCGDGIKAGAEECDDGNLNDNDTCQNNCTRPKCDYVDGSQHAAIKNMAANLGGGQPLATAMANSNVPGVSIAIRDVDGVVYTAVFGNAFNAAYDAEAPPLSPSTLFAAASISKAISSMAYLASNISAGTKDGNIAPVVQPFIALPWAITPADLVSHSAGTAPHAFISGGYVEGDALPTAEEIVLGKAPSKAAGTSFFAPTKGIFSYSAGGYMLWQSWLERATTKPVAQFISENLLSAAGTKRSNFTQPLPSAVDHDVACGRSPFLVKNKICRKVYPETVVAGMFSTPTELACIATYLVKQRPDVLKVASSRSLFVDWDNGTYPQRMGLGIFHRPANGVDETQGHFYEHSGHNDGFLSQMAFFDDGRVVVAMDNGEAANGGISGFVVRALCRELKWPCQGASVGWK